MKTINTVIANIEKINKCFRRKEENVIRKGTRKLPVFEEFPDPQVG